MRLFWLPLISGLILWVDFQIPLGVACGVLYVVVVLLSLRTGNQRHVTFVAVATSVLVLLKWKFSSPSGEAWKVMTNRFLSIFVIWSVAIVGIYYQRAAKKLRQAERELAKSETLAALGRMTAILAHQIRNPLGAVVTAGTTISVGGLSVQEGKELHAVLEHESRRLNQFLEKILRFTRLQKVDLTEADLNQEMEVVLEATRPDPSLQPKS